MMMNIDHIPTLTDEQLELIDAVLKLISPADLWNENAMTRGVEVTNAVRKEQHSRKRAERIARRIEQIRSNTSEEDEEIILRAPEYYPII